MPLLPRIGFIGIGNMGSRMAANLLKKKFPVTVFDAQPLPNLMTPLIAAGAAQAISISSLAEQADVFISMVPATFHVQELYLSGNGLLQSLHACNKTGALMIDCSTIDPIASVAVGDAVRAQGHMFVDAPVSGGIVGAEAGTLTFMVGATESDHGVGHASFVRVSSILSAMGKPVACGGPGKGAAVKVANNLILGISMLGVAEGYRLAEALGVDLKLFDRIVNTSSGQCWSSEKYNPVPGLKDGVPASRGYSGGFAIDLMTKDLGLAVTAGQATNTPVDGAEWAKKEYAKVSAKGKGRLDFGCVYQELK